MSLNDNRDNYHDYNDDYPDTDPMLQGVDWEPEEIFGELSSQCKTYEIVPIWWFNML